MQRPAPLSLKTIVVATDLSGTSTAALQYARQLAARFGSRVVLAHVVDPVGYANLSNTPGPVLDRLSEEARAEIGRLAEEFLSAGIPSHSEVRQGVVTQLLLQVIAQHQADLLILGTRGAHGAGPAVVGSVAEQLVRLAPCPVLAVAADAAGSADLQGANLLVPVEKNDVSLDAVVAAQTLASQCSGSLVLLHALAEHDAVPDPCVETMGRVAFPKADTRVPVRCVVRKGSAEEVIPAAAEQYHAALIVLGVNRESRSKGVKSHGTAYEVIARSRVPVLLVPPATATATAAAAAQFEASPC